MFGNYEIGLNYYFVIVVNTMLLIMSLVNYYRIQKMDPTNANAMVRSVMLGTLLKMAVFAVAALIYATQKKGPVGIPTLLVSMGIYMLSRDVLPFITEGIPYGFDSLMRDLLKIKGSVNVSD